MHIYWNARAQTFLIKSKFLHLFIDECITVFLYWFNKAVNILKDILWMVNNIWAESVPNVGTAAELQHFLHQKICGLISTQQDVVSPLHALSLLKWGCYSHFFLTWLDWHLQKMLPNIQRIGGKKWLCNARVMHLSTNGSLWWRCKQIWKGEGGARRLCSSPQFQDGSCVVICYETSVKLQEN